MVDRAGLAVAGSEWGCHILPRSGSEGSIAVACLVGALLAVPGPFDLIAVGRLARNGYGIVAGAGMMIVFALIKFVLIEIANRGLHDRPPTAPPRGSIASRAG
jgi:hypothetical protein